MRTPERTAANHPAWVAPATTTILYVYRFGLRCTRTYTCNRFVTLALLRRGLVFDKVGTTPNSSSRIRSRHLPSLEINTSGDAHQIDFIKMLQISHIIKFSLANGFSDEKLHRIARINDKWRRELAFAYFALNWIFWHYPIACNLQSQLVKKYFRESV